MDSGETTGPADGANRVGVIEAAMAAWARHDVDGVLAHVTDDIEWHYQVGSRPAVGRDAMRRVLERLKDHQVDSKWRIVRSSQTGDLVFIEAVDDYRNPDGHRVQVPYAGVYRLDGDRIAEWRDYVDLGLLMKGERGETPDEWLLPLIEAKPER